jgi:Phytanoyl-CoA dioxygenase (PhyH)
MIATSFLKSIFRRSEPEPGDDGSIKFADISTDYSAIDPAERPYLDRQLSRKEYQALDDQQRFWYDNGYLVLPGFMPDALIDAYCKVRETLDRPGGWGPVPYLYYDEIKDFCLYPPLRHVLEKLLGDKVILHLNLTGWVSTSRNWHQDEYLNEECVKGSYLAVWTALDTIDPNSGPFEFFPGSHKWRVLNQKKIRDKLPEFEAAQRGQPGDQGHWASYSQDFVSQASEVYAKSMGGQVKQFLGKRGDVLIWHSCLLHRGSEPKVPGTLRKSLIAHYSGQKNRTDFPANETLTHAPSGGLYQDFPGYPLG